MSESSGIFTFPQTGIYHINMQFRFTVDNGDTSGGVKIETTVDNSTYTMEALAEFGNGSTSDIASATSQSILFDVTDITTHKFKFSTSSFSTNTSVTGNTNYMRSGFTVTRIGDT